MTDLDVRPFGAALGAEVVGLDLRTAGDPEVRTALREALLTHQVLAFRDQHLSDDEHFAFAATLGELYVHPMDRIAGIDTPEMGRLETTRDHQTQTDTWHVDVPYSPRPPAFAVNRCLVAPPVGGDTMWANLQLALDTLTPPFRERLYGLFTVNNVPEILIQLRSARLGAEHATAQLAEKWRAELCDVHQPVVRRHPETGRDSLFAVGTTCPIAGMSDMESSAILSVLERHAQNPNFTCRWRWHEGDVVVWDERCTSHFAVRDPWDGSRSMRRVLVEGDAAIPATLP